MAHGLLLELGEGGLKRGKIMAPQILVALKSEDRLSQMIPYIEKIVQPGMKVVFLIGFRPQAASTAPRYNSLALKYLEDVRFGGELEIKPMFAGENISETPSMEEQRLSAEHKVFLALEALHKRGVEITVDVYAGSLKRVVKDYTRKGNVHFIMKRVGRVSADDAVCPHGVPYFRLVQAANLFSRTPALFCSRSLGIKTKLVRERDWPSPVTGWN